jgi:hypothetical protein
MDKVRKPNISESIWNVYWQGEPKFSEKTCPSTTFVQLSSVSIVTGYGLDYWGSVFVKGKVFS